MTAIELPAGHHYSIMWDIPDDYAGMTNSMLHRSRAFVELAGVEVTIVTYEHRTDYDEVRAKLRERGAVIDGINVINLWEDLRTWDDAQLKEAVPTFTPGFEAGFEPLGDRGDHGNPLLHALYDDEGEPIQIDYFRADGTLLGSHLRQTPTGDPTHFTLFDTSGSPLGTWDGVRHLYRFWLDSLPRDPIAWMIVDSKTSANHVVKYDRDDVVTMHVVHGSHLKPRTGRPMGELSESRMNVMNQIEKWDAVIFLTQQQRSEVDALLGPGDNRHVIPHGRHVPSEVPKLRRSRTRGVMLTSLTARKQISHAIRAMAKVGRIGLRRPRLDVWGHGPQQEKLQKLIDEQEGINVTLRGYSETAINEFDKASFSLLTSSNEAFGLVLVESMGRGCIPISYDMPYGPAEVITHGVDGFLVPSDDVAGLATEIRRLARAKQSDLARIRRAAHRRATEYNDESVTERWAEVMRTALEAKRRG